MIAAAAPLRGHPSDLHQLPNGHELPLPYQTDGNLEKKVKEAR
jgi:hypothetical protein